MSEIIQKIDVVIIKVENCIRNIRLLGPHSYKKKEGKGGGGVGQKCENNRKNQFNHLPLVRPIWPWAAETSEWAEMAALGRPEGGGGGEAGSCLKVISSSSL